jgi:uncharacterized SAM-binding protein YcdF (DUF218 family)
VNIYLSKLLSLAIYPITWVFLLLIISLLLLALKRIRTASITIGFSLISFWIIAMPVTGQWVMHALESQYEAKQAKDTATADIIVLLGGGMAGATPPIRPMPELLDSADRVWFAAQLYNEQKAPTIIASGGILTWRGVSQSEASAMRLLLEQLNVPSNAIIDEDQSLTTYENALHSRPLLQSLAAKRILLVTSAAHMPRAMAVFSKQFPEDIIIPAITDIRVIAVGEDLLDWLPQASGIAQLNEAWHEWIGLFVYRLKGQA